MREIFLEYAKSGAMTKSELATVLKCPISFIGSLVRKRILRPIPHLRPQKFDPHHLIEVFCGDSKQVRSLTTEGRKSSGNPKTGGFRKCL
jgi:hypothetical protein